MKVWLSYLIDRMEPFGPRFEPATCESGLRVGAICRWFPESGTLRPYSLYVCLEDDCPGPDTVVPEGTCFVTKAGMGEWLPRRVALDRFPLQREVYSLLMDAVEDYQTWIEELMRLSLLRAGAQEFLDVSESLLKNPVLVQNPSYSLIAISKSANREDYPSFDFEGTRTPIPEFLFSMQREFKRESEQALDGMDLVVGSLENRVEAHCSIIHEGEICVRVTCAITRTPLTRGLLDLFVEFCRYLRHSLNITLLLPQPGGDVNYAIEQLTRYGKSEAMLSLLRVREERTFQTAVLDTRDSRLPGYLTKIQEMIPNSVAFLHNGLVAVVLCIDDKETEAIYWAYQHQRLQALAEAIGGRFGLSYPMNSLTDLESALEQGARALALDRKGERLCSYEEQAVADILERFFADRPLEAWLPPEIAALLRADRESGQNNCRVLYHYLLSGKSLSATAEAMHMHRSTVVYRLDRMKKSYGIQLDDPVKNELCLLCCQACLAKLENDE